MWRAAAARVSAARPASRAALSTTPGGPLARRWQPEKSLWCPTPSVEVTRTAVHSCAGVHSCVSAAYSSAAAAAAASPTSAGATGGSSSNHLLGALVLFAPSAVCAALCKWQVDRYTWKRTELASREAALSVEALTPRHLTKMLERGERPAEYTRVCVEGQLDVTRSVRIAPRTTSVHGTPIPGAVVITALTPRRRGAATVLVNRGWAPDTWREPKGGTCVKAVGVVRRSETPSAFVPENDAAVGRWHWVDVPAIAAALGLPPDTPLVQLVKEGPPGEQGKGSAGATAYPAAVHVGELRGFKVMPQDHVNYAVTWGGLAVATGVLAMQALRARRGGGGGRLVGGTGGGGRGATHGRVGSDASRI